jgi:hypothetical protein
VPMVVLEEQSASRAREDPRTAAIFADVKGDFQLASVALSYVHHERLPGEFILRRRWFIRYHATGKRLAAMLPDAMEEHVGWCSATARRRWRCGSTRGERNRRCETDRGVSNEHHCCEHGLPFRAPRRGRTALLSPGPQAGDGSGRRSHCNWRARV